MTAHWNVSIFIFKIFVIDLIKGPWERRHRKRKNGVSVACGVTQSTFKEISEIKPREASESSADDKAYLKLGSTHPIDSI